MSLEHSEPRCGDSLSSGFDSKRFRQLMAARRAHSMPEDRDLDTHEHSPETFLTGCIVQPEVKDTKIRSLRQHSDLGLSPENQEDFSQEIVLKNIRKPLQVKAEGGAPASAGTRQASNQDRQDAFDSKRVQELQKTLLSKHFSDDADPHLVSKAKRLKKFPSLQEQGSPRALAALAELAKTSQPPRQLLREFQRDKEMVPKFSTDFSIQGTRSADASLATRSNDNCSSCVSKFFRRSARFLLCFVLLVSSLCLMCNSAGEFVAADILEATVHIFSSTPVTVSNSAAFLQSWSTRSLKRVRTIRKEARLEMRGRLRTTCLLDVPPHNSSGQPKRMIHNIIQSTETWECSQSWFPFGQRRKLQTGHDGGRNTRREDPGPNFHFVDTVCAASDYESFWTSSYCLLDPTSCAIESYPQPTSAQAMLATQASEIAECGQASTLPGKAFNVAVRHDNMTRVQKTRRNVKTRTVTASKSLGNCTPSHACIVSLTLVTTNPIISVNVHGPLRVPLIPPIESKQSNATMTLDAKESFMEHHGLVPPNPICPVPLFPFIETPRELHGTAAFPVESYHHKRDVVEQVHVDNITEAIARGPSRTISLAGISEESLLHTDQRIRSLAASSQSFMLPPPDSLFAPVENQGESGGSVFAKVASTVEEILKGVTISWVQASF